MPRGFGVGAWQPLGAPTQKTALPAVAGAGAGAGEQALELLGSATQAATTPGLALQSSTAWRSDSQDGGLTRTYWPPASHWIDVTPERHVR
jgi:hypothetical protein